MKNKNKNKGFTLIELIVSVTIIAVLTVAGVISYGGSSKKARDSRRMADLEKIRMALELYRQGVGSSYPGSGLTNLENALINNGYLQTIPTGPKDEIYGNSYTRDITSNYKYSICAAVEDLGSTSIDTAGCPTVITGYVGNYKVTNP